MNHEPLTKPTGLRKIRWALVKSKAVHDIWYSLVYLMSDFYVVSYPRSGRTWTKTMLYKVLQETYGLKRRNLDLYKITLGTRAPNIVFEHPQCSDYPIDENFDRLSIPKKFNKMKMVLILRNPHDLVVSNYFEYTTRKKRWQGDMSTFIRKRFGTERIIEFINLWYPFCVSRNDKALIIYYEEMKQNPARELKQICRFFDIPASDEIIKSAVEFGSVDNMRKLEQEDYFKNDKIRPANTQNKESYKVRKAKVVGFRNYLNKSDIEYIDGLIKLKLNPDVGYYGLEYKR